MKLNDFVSSPTSGIPLNVDFLTKAKGDLGATPTIGVEGVINPWLYQQISNRAYILQFLYALTMSVSELRSPILVIRNEVFRKGFEWVDTFTKKCKKCGRKFGYPPEKCDKCGGEEFAEPDVDQRERGDLFIKHCNSYNQTLKDLLRQLSLDLNICDDAYIALVKEYFDDGEGNVRSRVKELRRIHPALIEFDVDSYGRILNRHWTCHFHRNVIVENPGVCSECNRELVPLMYHYSPMLAGAGVGLSMGISTQEPAGQERYFLPSEIVKKSKFNTSEIYGMSPIFTIFEKVMTLIGMDKMLYKYFWERKVPSSMILTTTDDPESLRRERDYVRAEMKKDPDMIPWIGVSQRTGRGRTEMIRLFHTLQEMDYIPVKQEIRERIAALYGVSPVWQGATEAKGGIVSQTQELVVTSRAVEHEQQIFNDILDSICDDLGITDWRLRLRQPEEKAEATRLQFTLQRVQAAQTALAMGFDVKLVPGAKMLDDVTFEISGEATKQEGGMGGFPGMMSEDTQEWAQKAAWLNWVLLGGPGSGRKSPGFRPDQEKTLDADAPGVKDVLQPKVKKDKKGKVTAKKVAEDDEEDEDDIE